MKETRVIDIQQDIKNLGDIFKRRREEKNLSLKEAENGTSIRMSYLQAIEEGQVDKLISPVYAKGFMKQYALFLGVDAEGMIEDSSALFGSTQKQDFSYGIGTLEVRDNPGARVKWIPNLLWVGGFCTLFAMAWYFAKYLEVI